VLISGIPMVDLVAHKAIKIEAVPSGIVDGVLAIPGYYY
jgi:hypothetical protein